MSAQPIPDGFHTVTPSLVVPNTKAAIAFYERAFGAQIRNVHEDPSGRVMHAEIRIGSSIVMMNDEYPEWGSISPLALKGTPLVLQLYVEDADAVFNQALQAGATQRTPLMDAFWGDRYGQVVDPFGHIWGIATHKEDLTEAQVESRAQAFFAKAATQNRTA
jgi:uncharacterized glyoxalase superfamily protein PhnB